MCGGVGGSELVAGEEGAVGTISLSDFASLPEPDYRRGKLVQI